MKGKKFLSDLKLYSDYLKWKEDLNRYERWSEACEDIINGHKQKFKNHKNSLKINEYLEDALVGMINQDILASQRSLQYRYEQLEQHNSRLFNCTVGHVCNNDIFQKVFYLLLSGCGYGGGILIPMIKNLSNIEKRTEETITYVIEDSIEGWANALGVLLSSYFTDNQPFPEFAGKQIRFDYSLIRPEGSYISGGFKAPGPDPLKNSLEQIEAWIEKWLNEEGNEIRPILAMDIICMSSNAVLAGGVRRAALDMILDPHDEESINAKMGNWKDKYPWRERSNNSVILIEGYYDKAYFQDLIEKNDGMSDIGFVFGKSWLDMFNPCVSSDSLIPTAEGLFFPESLLESDNISLNSQNFKSSGFRKTGYKPLLELETNSGRKIKVTHEHLMFTEKGLMAAQVLEVGDKLTISNNSNKEIKYDLNSDDYKIGYLLGSFLGDGNFSKESCEIKFWGENNSHYHNKCVDFINDLNWNYRNSNKHLSSDKEKYTCISNKQLYKFIESKDSSVLTNKRLSKKLLEGSYDYLNGIISGYFDADGTVLMNFNKGNSIRIISVQLENLENLQIALNALGIYSKIYKNRNKSLNGVNTLPDGKGGSKEYSVQLSHELVITKEGIDKFNNLGFLNIEKRRIINLILDSYKRSFNKTSYFEEIVAINTVNTLDSVYDCSVEFGIEAFECNGFMVHNCFEISFTPVNIKDIDLTKIHYDDLYEFVKINKDKFGIMGCNLTEINAEKPKNLKEFLDQCRRATILGTVQAYYTNFPYLGKVSEELFRREALLGVSITGITNNPKLVNKEWLEAGAAECVRVNKELSAILGINQAARVTCIKPSGNASVVLGTPSGIHPEHSEKYFRIMQLNKQSETAKYLNETQPWLLEESLQNPNHTDYVVYVPIINPSDGLFKKDLKGVKHLELIKLVQQHWVIPGTNKELGISPNINHNVSATVIVDNKQEIIDYIWDNKDSFTALSFLSDYGDKDYNQAPYTSVLSHDEILTNYGKGSLFASGLIIDGLHYFNGNLWEACKCVLDKSIPLVGTREQVLLQGYWLKRAKKFAKNYFKGDLQKMVYCLKDVHLFHKWETITRQFKEVNFEEILIKPDFKNIGSYGAASCSGGACEITRI